MPCLQPEIVIIDGFYQDGPHPTAIGAQGVRKDLIAHQSSFLRRNAVLGKALPDPTTAGFLSMGDAIQAIGSTKLFYPVITAVGYHTHCDIGAVHHSQPIRHFGGGDAGGIGHDGIVKIQHQQPDIVQLQELRR